MVLLLTQRIPGLSPYGYSVTPPLKIQPPTPGVREPLTSYGLKRNEKTQKKSLNLH